MRKFNTKVGDKFNYLTIKEFTREQYVGKYKAQLIRYCLAECECGSVREYAVNNIKSGMSKSCGCKPVMGCKNNISLHPLHSTYAKMLYRCSNAKDKSYADYGGRGIKVCDRWKKSFINFLADMGERPSEDYSLDRIDNDGNYEPSNCRWATQKEQMNNTRRSFVLTASNLARATGYTNERIRQLSGLSNNQSKSDILVGYIISDKQSNNGYHNIIYKEEAIEFLLQRKAQKLINKYV